MKKLLVLASVLLVPATSFAGGYGVDLSSYKKATTSVERAPLANTEINITPLSQTRYASVKKQERRSATGYRLPQNPQRYYQNFLQTSNTYPAAYSTESNTSKRGISYEQERQNAAKLKLLRLRGIGR